MAAAIQADIGDLDDIDGNEMVQGLTEDEAGMIQKIEDAMHESDVDGDYEEEE